MSLGCEGNLGVQGEGITHTSPGCGENYVGFWIQKTYLGLCCPPAAPFPRLTSGQVVEAEWGVERAGCDR